MVERKPKRRASPRAKRPGTFHHGDLREALVVEAMRIVEKHGHPELSLRPLADTLGVSQPAVYRHFASREALLAEVANRAWQSFELVLAGAGKSAKKPREALRNIGRTYVRWAYEHPHLFRLLSSRVPSDERDAPLPPFPREHYFAGLGGAVPLDEPKLADVFRTAWAHTHGLATFVVERTFMLVDTDDERLAVADASIDVFVEMVAARWP